MLPDPIDTLPRKGYALYTGGSGKYAAVRADGKAYVLSGRSHRALQVPRWVIDLLIFVWRLKRDAY